MDVLVTGGAGYIGSTLVPHLLSAGHRVRVLDRLMHGGRSLLGVWSHPEFECLKGDVRDAEVRQRALSGADAVVHLAAVVGDPACAEQPEVARSTNLEASLHLMEEANDGDVERFAFASTCSNYGKMEDEEYVDEDSPLRPVSLYAETKVSAEEAVLDPEGTENLCATSLRFATVFGVSPRMRFDLTVNHFTMEMEKGRELVVYGEQFWRPYVHVRDVARGIEAVLDAEESTVDNDVFNVGSTDQNFQKQMVVDEIVDKIPDVDLEYVRQDEDPRDYRVSFEKIRETLDYETTVSVEDGVEEVLQLVRDGVIEDVYSSEFQNV